MGDERHYARLVEVQPTPPHAVPERWQVAVDALVAWYDGYVQAYAKELDMRGIRKPRLFGYAWNTGRVILCNLAQSCTPPDALVTGYIGALEGFRELADHCTDEGRAVVIRGWPSDIYDHLQRLLDSDGQA